MGLTNHRAPTPQCYSRWGAVIFWSALNLVKLKLLDHEWIIRTSQLDIYIKGVFVFMLPSVEYKCYVI